MVGTAEPQWSDSSPKLVSGSCFSQCLKNVLVPRAAVLHGQLYMCGGLGRENMPLSSVERFDATHDTWERLAPMTHARVAARAVEIDGRLFMCGSFGADHTNLNSAEWFEPATGRWELLPRTTQRRDHPHLAVLSC